MPVGSRRLTRHLAGEPGKIYKEKDAQF